MNARVEETTDDYFEHMWSLGDDPWEHASRFYEFRKYELTVAALQRARYRLAFEPGCGIGLLTGRLARRCDHVIASDRHPRAVRVARARARDLDVEVRLLQLPVEWPSETFDLIVLSEILYYFAPSSLNEILDTAAQRMDEGGELVAVHYRRPVAEHALGGDAVHEILQSYDGFEPRSSYVEADFRLDGFVRR